MTRNSRGDADLPPGPARDLVDLFRRLPHRRSLSLGQVTITTKLSPSHVSEVLRGWKIPSQEAAATIARAFGATDEEAREAHRLAGQARELKKYQRAHSEPPPAGRRPQAPALGPAPARQDHPPTSEGPGPRSPATPVHITHPLDDVFVGLSTDERSYFVAEAQGGELAWFLEGRQRETEQVSAWLHLAPSGMLVVTGRAGSGKSAVLGNVLVLSLPPLRDALAQRGMIAVPEPTRLPPQGVFDAVIHLRGLTLQQATRRICLAIGLGGPPSQPTPALGIANDQDWLARQLSSLLATRDRPLTILADALDESTDPPNIARALLARIAALPRVKVLVGTRPSTRKTHTGNDNLLRALGAGAHPPGHIGKSRAAGQAIAVARPDVHAWLASAGGDGTVRIWDPVTGYQVGDPLVSHTGTVWALCALPGVDRLGKLDGRTWLASAGRDGTLRIWDPVTGCQVGGPLAAHFGPVWALCALPGLGQLASAGSDGTVLTWDAMVGRSVGVPLTGHTSGVAGVCALPGVDGLGKPDGRTWLASAGRDGTVRIWNAATGRPAGRQMAGHTSSVTGVCALSGADGRAWLASAGRDGTVRVWDPVTGGQVGDPLAGHAGPVWGVCALPGADGRAWLASAGRDGTVRVWDPVTGGQVGDPLAGHAGPVWGVCALPGADGQTWLASVGPDGTVRVWDPVTGGQVGDPLTGHASVVTGVCAVPRVEQAARPEGQTGKGSTVVMWVPSSTA